MSESHANAVVVAATAAGMVATMLLPHPRWVGCAALAVTGLLALLRPVLRPAAPPEIDPERAAAAAAVRG